MDDVKPYHECLIPPFPLDGGYEEETLNDASLTPGHAEDSGVTFGSNYEVEEEPAPHPVPSTANRPQRQRTAPD